MLHATAADVALVMVDGAVRVADPALAPALAALPLVAMTVGGITRRVSPAD